MQIVVQSHAHRSRQDLVYFRGVRIVFHQVVAEVESQVDISFGAWMIYLYFFETICDFSDSVLDVIFVGLKSVVFELFVNTYFTVIVVINVSLGNVNFFLLFFMFLVVSFNLRHLLSESKQQYI